MRFALFLLLSLCLYSCEEEFIPDAGDSGQDLVVEGYIEAGEDALPPYVFLTRSLPFFNSLDSNALAQYYVHGAEVQVTHNGTIYPLTELCLSQLSPAQQEQLASLLGFDPDSLQTDICVYLDLSGQLKGEAEQTYELNVQADGKTYHAVTTIPRLEPIDSFYFKQMPDPRLAEYRDLRVFVTDSADQKDYWRYLTSVNGRPYTGAQFASFDDSFGSGQTIESPLPKGEEADDPTDPLYFGLYHVGDTVSVKWMSIDSTTYQFWRTVEFSRVQGPFSSYVRVAGNVSDALGIWGGYHVQIIRAVVQ